MKVVPLQRSLSVLEEYELFLSGKSNKTVDAYIRVLRQFTKWISERPGTNGKFHPEFLTRTALETYCRNWEQKATVSVIEIG